MVSRRSSSVAIAAAVVILSASVFAQPAPPPQQRKLSDAEKKEIQTILKIVDDVAAGQPAPNDLSLTWVSSDLLKAQNNKEYLPFTVSFDRSKLSGGKATMYWRVVAKGAAAAAPAPTATDGKKDDKKDDKKAAKPEYPYEDINTLTLSGDSANKISRSFTVGAGDYEVYVVLKEPTPEKAKKGDPAPKVSLLKQSLTVPDLWNGELNTSSVIVAERIDPLPAPLNAQQQGERPYALGTMEIVPAASTKFSKKGELSTFVLIYNAKTDAQNKPDVLVEYNFYQKPAGKQEAFFNKTNPQPLNAQTLPPQFDFTAGHQLQSGQAVPLASFPEGDYRLEIKVTDKLANKTLTRDVNFSVMGS